MYYARKQFATAARHTLKTVNPASISENRKYGESIYKNKNRMYSYSKGSAASVSLGYNIPSGITLSADYHTHGFYDPLYNNENFSPTDIEVNKIFQINGYLAIPKNQFKYYQYGGNNIYNLNPLK